MHITIYLGRHAIDSRLGEGAFSYQGFARFMPVLRETLEEKYPEQSIHISPVDFEELFDTDMHTQVSIRKDVVGVINRDWERINGKI